MNYLKKIAACLFILLNCKSYSQQYRFISYSVSNGLSQNSVHCIFQDSDGLLWLGTQDGLNSFNGHNFITYRYNSRDTTSISDQFVLSITEDNKGFLWVGTRNGLNKLNRRTGKFTRYYLSSEEKNQLGRTYPLLNKNSKGEIYVSHDGNASLIDANGKLVQGNEMVKKSIAAVFDNSGKLWTIQDSSRLGYIEIKNNTHYWRDAGKLIENIPENHSVLFTIDSTQTIWYCRVSPKSDLYFYDTRKKKWRVEKIHFPSLVNHINITHSGTGWVSTLDGIYLINQYRITGKIDHTSSESGSLPAGSFLCTYEDSQGNIWAGNAYSGFAYYHPSFDHFNLLQTSQLGASVTSVVDINDRLRWVGTTNGLLKATRRDAKQEYHLSGNFFSSMKITALAKDKANRLWVAVENNGLYILDTDGSVLHQYRESSSFAQAKGILNLLCDSKGRIIVCTIKGYYIFQPAGKWPPLYRIPGAGDNAGSAGLYILHAFEDSKKNIWLSKNLGIDVLDENLKLKFSIPSSKAGSPIDRTIIVGCTEDKAGNVWIATLSSGIYRYSHNQLTRYTTDDGLNSNVIYGVTCDDKGRLWAVTTSGVNIYDQQKKRFFSLSSRDGLPADDFVLNAIYANKSGQVLLGSSKGLISANANDIVLQKQTAIAQVSDLKVDGESVVTYANTYVLEPGYRTVGFEFSLKQALQPRKIIYQYQMKGFDKNWNTLLPDNTRITYSKLPFEILTMRVRAAYSLQDLADAPVEEFRLTVKPAFWQTTWFALLAITMVILLISAGAVEYNRVKYRKRLQNLQVQTELQQERERISRDLHDNIGAYTSALIAGINQLKSGETKAEDMEELSEYAANIMGYLRETIWVLNHETLTLTDFSDRLTNYARKIIKHYPSINLTIIKDISVERELPPQVSLNLFRILQEALQNACKHAEPDCIELSVVSDEQISFSVKDSGLGMQDTENKDSYGLQNMTERAKDIGFTLFIYSEKNTGTTVTCKENNAYAV